MTSDQPILVVGAGPSGLTMACELFRLGIGCRVVDAAPLTEKGSRAIGVSARSLEVLDAFGAAEPLVAKGLRSTSAVFYSQRAPIGRVSANSVRDTRFPFMLTVPQPETERVLNERLAALGGAVEREVELRELIQEPDGRSVTVVLAHADGTVETVNTPWLIGADGAHSVVRKLSGIGFTGEDAKDTFVIVDVLADGGPPVGEGHYYFHPDGLSLVAPLPDGAYRLAATADRDEVQGELTLDRVQRLFSRRIDPAIRITRLRNAGWGVATTQVRPRMASTFRAGRCLIAGDAAHLFGPVGGQGMNGAIQDVQNLAWKLALVSLGAADEALLDTYEAERLPAAHVAMAAASSQTRLGTLKPWFGRTVRDLALRLGTRTGKLNARIVPSLTQLTTTYPANDYLRGGALPGVGQRIPDTEVGDAGDARTLFDLLRRSWFTVLVLGARSDEATQRLADSVAALDGHPAVTTQVIALHRDGAMLDRAGRLHELLDVREPTAYLIRPDGYVAAAGPLAAASSIVAALARFTAVSSAPVSRSDGGR
ncbi:MAG TPA: FAD-dependent monooxygenase [Pseudonocardiaceae bacterium]|jgi:2-polyprenyl-6-methoxyphenol hydroxylase-like FAD-dependent oxidoreductase|nr:FAD-dependent monooxygenase [Pseudonocardiaceae bacterium]